MAELGIARVEQETTMQCIEILSLPTLEGRTQESEPTTGKLVDELDVAASPCHVGDSRYSSIQSTLLDHASFTFIPTRIFAHRRLTFCNIYEQSINSVQFTFLFHGRVYRQFRYLRYIFADELHCLYQHRPVLGLKYKQQLSSHKLFPKLFQR